MDYLASRADIVDPARIGMSGCSGGGTQTMYLSSFDSRVRFASPPSAPALRLRPLRQRMLLGEARALWPRVWGCLFSFGRESEPVRAEDLCAIPRCLQLIGRRTKSLCTVCSLGAERLLEHPDQTPCEPWVWFCVRNRSIGRPGLARPGDAARCALAVGPAGDGQQHRVLCLGLRRRLHVAGRRRRRAALARRPSL